MLVQALAAYTDRYLADQLNDAAWETKPVPWQIEISNEGMFLGITSRMTSEPRGKKMVSVPMKLSVPRSPVNRNSGHHPLLGADDIAYVLGVGAWTPAKPSDREKAERHFEAFQTLIGKAAEATGDEALLSCGRFYDSPAEVDKAREALRDAKAGSLVVLSVDGALVKRPEVQAYWRKHYQVAFERRMEGSDGECLISGCHGVIAPTHEKIKGMSSLGGQASGVSLMSFDKEAFRSYGWEQNENSPVSPDRAMAYVLALNDLLQTNDGARSGPGRRRDIAGVGFVYWLRDTDAFDTLDMTESPSTDQVRDLLRFNPKADPQPNHFYLAGLSGNGGRLRVRYWVDLSLALVKSNLKNWHEQLRISYPWEPPGPVQMWQLRYAIDRDGEPEAHQIIALYRRAIEGPSRPLGYAMLAAALNRLRHPGGGKATKHKDSESDPQSLGRWRVPMGLIRLCLNDIFRTKPGKGEQEMTEGLQENCRLPAYVCGRLMAEFENLQKVSSESEVNSSILDRYFALASTYPAIAFPKIEALGLKHMRKLRRDKPPTAYAIDARIRKLHDLLQPSEQGAFPGRLGLEAQGLFALGYYHQKSWSISQAVSRKQENQENKDAQGANE